MNAKANVERSPALFALISFLILAGLMSSIYLTRLYVRVNNPQGRAVESFCAVSDKVNCVTVANSRYSTFLGIPVATWGVEFYLLAAAFLLLALWDPWPLKGWGSPVFLLAVISIPICAILAYISMFVIRSLCIVCCIVYAVNVLILVFLSLANRRGLDELIASGPREMFKLISEPGLFRNVLIATALVAVSQFFWMPMFFKSGASAGQMESSWKGLPVNGLALGRPDAPVIIEEFTDFQCPYCGKAHQVIMELIGNHPDQIHLVHRDDPLDIDCNPYMKRPFHPDSCRAALYARCAARQKKFRPLEEMLFNNRHRMKKQHLDGYARQVGLDMYRLNECLEDPSAMDEVLEDIHEAKRRGVSGTPTFFVNGERIRGYKPLEFWESKLAEILEKKVQ